MSHRFDRIHCFVLVLISLSALVPDQPTVLQQRYTSILLINPCAIYRLDHLIRFCCGLAICFSYLSLVILLTNHELRYHDAHDYDTYYYSQGPSEACIAVAATQKICGFSACTCFRIRYLITWINKQPSLSDKRLFSSSLGADVSGNGIVVCIAPESNTCFNGYRRLCDAEPWQANCDQ